MYTGDCCFGQLNGIRRDVNLSIQCIQQKGISTIAAMTLFDYGS